MATQSLLALAAAAALLPAASACAAARRVAGAPYAPGVPITDARNESHLIADMVYDDFEVARLVANLSTVYATDLCVWTQQALPSPPAGLQPDGSCEPAPCAWPPLPTVLADVQSLAALGAQAIERMALMDVGAHSFLGSTCGGGSGNAAVLCAADPGSSYCAPGLLAMRTRWAVASNIVKVTAQTLDAVIANYSLWRGSSAWHLPAMTSQIVQRGWGFGGAITIKVLPCAAVPAPLVGTSYGCDAIDPATGRAVYDEAFDAWSEYKEDREWLREAVRRLGEGRRGPAKR